VLAPEGEIVEQRSGDPIELAIAEARGDGANETLLRDLVEALRVAKERRPYRCGAARSALHERRGAADAR
jgi:hypothetical protein